MLSSRINRVQGRVATVRGVVRPAQDCIDDRRQCRILSPRRVGPIVTAIRGCIAERRRGRHSVREPRTRVIFASRDGTTRRHARSTGLGAPRNLLLTDCSHRRSAKVAPPRTRQIAGAPVRGRCQPTARASAAAGCCDATRSGVALAVSSHTRSPTPARGNAAPTADGRMPAPGTSCGLVTTCKQLARTLQTRGTRG